MVYVPRYRRKSIYGTLRKDIGEILRELCRQQGIELGSFHHTTCSASGY
ncbi:hypothetical protein ACFL2V_17935 [Pseudomonadota bacterium]